MKKSFIKIYATAYATAYAMLLTNPLFSGSINNIGSKKSFRLNEKKSIILPPWL